MFARACRLCLLPAVAAITLVAAAPALGQEADLRPRFKAGDESRFEMRISGTSEFKSEEMPGGGNSNNIDQEIDISMKVKEVSEDGIAKVDLTYDRMKMSVRGMFDMEFDSSSPTENDAANRLAPAIRPLIGATLNLTIDRDGNITSVEGFDKLRIMPQAMQMIQSYATEQGVKTTFGQIFTTRKSGGRAKVGDTWTNEDVVPAGPAGTIKSVFTHTLKSYEGHEATVGITGEVTSDSMELKIVDSELNGSYIWDTEKGMLKSLETKQTSKVEADSGFGVMTISNSTKMSVTRKS